MKKLIVFVLVLISNLVNAQMFNNAYEQLVQVNEEWKNQNDIEPKLKSSSAYHFTEIQLIQFHLKQTEQLLRNRDVSKLSVELQKQRENNLNVLHSYWINGVFPINDLHQNRQPYFIDKNNTYCAVGYLMKMSGADAMAREIHNKQNYSYLFDISHPLLMDWASKSGLTLEELALIQPGYYANWPSSIMEMHYNNIGTDINEYIEIHQSSNTNYGGTADRLLFYDESNTLYKTLLLSQMQLNIANSMYSGYTYYYTFPSSENFADVGKIEILNTANQISSVITYTGNTVSVQDNFPTNGIPSLRSYNVGENETTPVGKSLTFCGYYYSTWAPELKTATTAGVVNSCTITPISLAKFDYTLNNKQVNLNWETISEINNSYFSIEKSSDGINFQTIGKVNGAGTSNSIKQYSFIDDKPDYINQYRLKQVDLDGTATYSKILFVKVQKAIPIIILENPVKQQLKLQINLDNSKIKSIVIYDFWGRNIEKINSLKNLQNINISTLSAGKYLLQLQTIDEIIYNIPFIKS